MLQYFATWFGAIMQKKLKFLLKKIVVSPSMCKAQDLTPSTEKIVLSVSFQNEHTDLDNISIQNNIYL
jgi:hypothetical protein